MVSEAYRSLRAAFLLSTSDELRTVCITSATPGDGKTATSANLAVVLAQLGKRVLLVDADLHKSRQHELFQASNRSGLASVLTGGAEANDVVQETAIDNLWLVPTGPSPPNPSELLASERMQDILDCYRHAFDLVIFDTPALLAVSDAVLIGARCEGLILCVRAGKSSRDDLVASSKRLAVAGVHTLGTVLNRYRAPARGSYYDYYHRPYAVSEGADSAG